MTFATEMARTFFHSLPTEAQLQYTRIEEQLANAGKTMHVIAIQTDGKSLEIVVRIGEQLNLRPGGAN